MRSTWDPGKARSNFDTHGVDFADAAVALEDPSALTIADTEHTEQDDETIRIISAREADKTEQRIYFEGGFNE